MELKELNSTKMPEVEDLSGHIKALFKHAA